MSLVLDAGALLAVEHRDDIVVRRLLNEADASSDRVLTSAGVVAQVWRNGSRQARLARMLASIEIWPLGHTAARRVGELLAISRSRDIVDAHVALLVHDGDLILTSDPRDIGRLLGSLHVAASVIQV